MPLRSIASFRGSVVVENREYVYESKLERGFIYISLASGLVEDYLDQPQTVTFRWPDGSKGEHTFDALLTLKDGTRVAVAVKPKKKVQRTRILEVLQLIEEQVGTAFADIYLLRTEDHIHPDDVYDAQLLLRARRLCAAVDEATKIVFGATLNWTPNADTAIRTLEMVCRDKTEIAMAAGCRSTWDHVCTPGTVPSDSGSEFIDAGFRCSVRDIGSTNEIGPASHPDARGVVERFFQSVDLQMMQFFQGRTFSGVDDKGDYDAGAVAHLVTEELGKALVRYIVDVYHNSPHAGLGGQTPNDAWEERSALYKVVPPPPLHVLRTVFGFSDNRRIQNRGVRFLGRYYRNDQVAKLRASVGQADIRMRADLEDLGMIWVSKNVPGAEWFAVPCEVDMKGVSAALWLEAAAALRRKHADVSRLREHIVHAALRDLRDAGRHSAAAAGIGPSAMSTTQLLKLEKELFEHFDYTVTGGRGHSFDGLEDRGSEAPDSGDDQTAVDVTEHAEATPDAVDEDDGGEPQRPVARRRGRLGSDFLRKD